MGTNALKSLLPNETKEILTAILLVLKKWGRLWIGGWRPAFYIMRMQSLAMLNIPTLGELPELLKPEGIFSLQMANHRLHFIRISCKCHPLTPRALTGYPRVGQNELVARDFRNRKNSADSEKSKISPHWRQSEIKRRRDRIVFPRAFFSVWTVI
jgi:hypothetical protein